MTPTPPTPRAKLARANSLNAKARVMYLDYDGSVNETAVAKSVPCAVIPSNLENRREARAQAARIARVANMTEGERVELAARAGYQTEAVPRLHKSWDDASDETKDQCRRVIRAVLSALGLASGGKAITPKKDLP